MSTACCCAQRECLVDLLGAHACDDGCAEFKCAVESQPADAAERSGEQDGLAGLRIWRLSTISWSAVVAMTGSAAAVLKSTPSGIFAMPDTSAATSSA